MSVDTTPIYAPDADALKASRLLPHEEWCNFMNAQGRARAIAMAEASKRPNRLAQLRRERQAQEEADLAKALAASREEAEKSSKKQKVAPEPEPEPEPVKAEEEKEEPIDYFSEGVIYAISKLKSDADMGKELDDARQEAEDGKCHPEWARGIAGVVEGDISYVDYYEPRLTKTLAAEKEAWEAQMAHDAEQAAKAEEK